MTDKTDDDKVVKLVATKSSEEPEPLNPRQKEFQQSIDNAIELLQTYRNAELPPIYLNVTMFNELENGKDSRGFVQVVDWTCDHVLVRGCIETQHSFDLDRLNSTQTLKF